MQRITLLSAIPVYCLVACLEAGAQIAPNPQPAVVPAIQEWIGGQGGVRIQGAEIVLDQNGGSQLVPIAQLFQQDLETIGLGKWPIVTSPRQPSGVHFFLTLGEPANTGKIALADQAYRVDIGDAVKITARTPTGVFYGTRTILQMLAQTPKEVSLPRGQIIDFPKTRGRMLMLDVARKVFPYETLLDYLRMMAWFKMNELHLHLSDVAMGGGYTGFRVECDTFPGLTSKDYFYTKKQLRALQDTARLYGITITPEIDMPGHAKVFTDYWPELRNPKLSANELDVTNPLTVDRMKKLLDEMIPIFDAPDFHIGTDEYGVGGTAEEKQKFYDGFHRFINTMNAYVRSKGKNCRIWDGWEHMKSGIEIDPTVVVDMWWGTFDAKGYAARGHSIINSNQGRSYIVPGAHYYGVSNAGIYNGWEPWMFSGKPEWNPAPDDPRFLGAKLHVWSDQGPAGYTMTEIANLTFPSLMAFSEKLWGCKGSKNYNEFEKRAELVKNVPGVRVFDRLAFPNSDGPVLALPGEHQLAADKFEPLFLAGKSRADLEYPWTITMSVQPTDSPKDRGVLLSSDLMEVCSDFSRTEEKKVKDPTTGAETKTKTAKHGFGLVRTCGTPGDDPSKSRLFNDVSRVYADPLPLNRWTAITIVGTKNDTVVYFNGRLAGEENEQMLCPLATLGSKAGHSFTGKVKDLSIYNRALSPKEIGRAAGLDIPDNLAAGCVVTASASDTGYGLTPDKITDEDPRTRWSSGPTGADQWIVIDLGALKNINSVNTIWEKAYAKEYRIAVSSDTRKWKEVFSGHGQEGITEAAFATITARYVKILMSQPANSWGYSVFETEVYLRKGRTVEPLTQNDQSAPAKLSVQRSL